MKIKGKNVIEVLPWPYWLELRISKEGGEDDYVCINLRQIQHIHFQQKERIIVISMNDAQKFEFIEDTGKSFDFLQRELNRRIIKRPIR